MTQTTEANGRIRPLGLREVRSSPKVRAYIEKANAQMAVIGYTEHGVRHAALVAAIARSICTSLDYSPAEVELASVAGYLHDIGNVVSRFTHPQIGATIAFVLLQEMGFEAERIATIIGAIGNHEEPEGVPINPITAAVILADKSDVHFTRVQNPDPRTYDIHDRVNQAVQRSRLRTDAEAKRLTLELTIDTDVASVMEYFEIFVERMVMCRKSAQVLGCGFALSINGVDM
jgi:hypothetical protein